MVTVKTPPEERLQKRMKHLPVALDNTVAKLDRLLAESEEYRMPVSDVVRGRFDELRSRYLTEPKLINDEWEHTIRAAQDANRG